MRDKKMTSVRFHYRPSKRQSANGQGIIIIRIVHDARTKEISTRYQINPEEWDPVNHIIRFPENNPERQKYLEEVDRGLRQEQKRILSIITLLEKNKKCEYNVDDIAMEVYGRDRNMWLSDFVKETADKMRLKGMERASRAYLTVYRDLMAFRSGKDIRLSEITLPFVMRYEKYMVNIGKQKNTISFYMRNFKALYNKGVQDGKVTKPMEDPFLYALVLFDKTAVVKPRKKTEEKIKKKGKIFNIENVVQASDYISHAMNNTSYLSSDRQNT